MKKSLIASFMCLVLCATNVAYAAPAGKGVDAYSWDTPALQVTMPDVRPVPQVVGYNEAELGRAITYYETYASQANRNENMRLATQAIHNVILQPGEVFSYNQTVGPRTAARGFKLANVFVGNKKVPGYGGGICQISSTLYMATKKSGLGIDERHVHSMPVTYCSRDDEATVSWGVLDYKFQNTLSVPVRIEATMQGGVCNIAIFSMTPVYA